MVNIKDSKMKALVMLALLFGLTILSGCLENGNNDENSIVENYEYEIQVDDYESGENYTLYLPFPVDSEGHNKDILEALKNQENGTSFEIVNKSKGICLKLTSDGNLTINLEGQLDKFDYKPSMYNYTYPEGEENYWVYSNSNETLHLTIYYERYSSMGSGSRKKYKGEGDIKEGWQLIDVETENEEG